MELFTVLHQNEKKGGELFCSSSLFLNTTRIALAKFELIDSSIIIVL